METDKLGMRQWRGRDQETQRERSDQWEADMCRRDGMDEDTGRGQAGSQQGQDHHSEV